MATQGRAEVVVIQRCIPDYRAALFEALWRRYGWYVATARNAPGSTYLEYADYDREYIRTYDFRFLDSRKPYRCYVPVRSIVNDLKPRVVIAEFSLSMSSSYDLAVRRLCGVGPQVLFWSHGWNMDRQRRGLGAFMQKPRIVLSRCVDGHITYSREGKKYLDQYLNPERVFLVRNTLGIGGQIRRRIASRQGGQTKKFRLITIGRLTEEKEVPRLIRIFRELLRDILGASLTIVGDGPDRDSVINAAGDELGRSVLMLGGVRDEVTLAECFGTSDLAIFAGAVGLSVNHALLHGVPVMAFGSSTKRPMHHPEIEYVVPGRTGWLVEPHTDAAMVKRLKEVFKEYPDPKAAFAASIEDFVTKEISVEVMLQDFDKVRRGVVLEQLSRM